MLNPCSDEVIQSITYTNHKYVRQSHIDRGFIFSSYEDALANTLARYPELTYFLCEKEEEED